MHYLSKLKQQITQAHHSNGFTLVEVLIIAPILILAISGFIVLIVTITGDVLKSNAGNQAAYGTQAAVDTFEQDARLATSFLTTSTTPESPQGYTNTAAPFNLNNSSGSPTTTVVAIMNMPATNKNPLDPTREIMYKRGALANCTNVNAYKQNDPYMINIVYFYTEDSGSKTLWRRTVFSNTHSSTPLCGGTIWQKRSCAPGTPASAICQTEDVKVLSNIDTIRASYFRDFSFTNPATYALTSTEGVGVELDITVNQKVAGVDVKRSGLIRATRIGSVISSTAPAAILSHPATTTTSSGRAATFSVTPSNSSANIQWQRSTDGGMSWANIPGATSPSYTEANTNVTMNDLYKYRAVVSNGSGTITSNPATLKVNLWGTLPLNSGYMWYGSPYPQPEYAKTSGGVVMVKGLVKRGSSSTAATPNTTLIGTLPDGLRPAKRIMFQTITHPQVASRIDILPNGQMYAIVANDGWLNLDGIKFIPTSTTDMMTNFTNAALPTNGWVNFVGADDWQTMQFGRDNIGRVHIRGLIRSGTVTDGTALLSNLPAAFRSEQYLHMPAFAAGPDPDNYGTIGIAQSSMTTGIVAKSRGSSYLMTQVMYYPSSFTTSTWNNLILTSPWVNYGGAFSTAQYRKASDNIVTLKGLIRAGGTQIARLPANCRPSETVIIASPSVNASGTTPIQGRIDIDKDGYMTIQAGTNAFISLDNINFIAATDGNCIP